MEYTRQRASSPVSLASLASALGIAAAGDAEILGVTADSRDVMPGDLFVAKPGAHVHGARFVPGAIDAGAVAVLTDSEGASTLPSGFPVLVVNDPGAYAGRVAAVVLDHPADALETYAVTGTNGKTTTTYYIADLLEKLGAKPGLIGTVEVRLAGTEIPAKLTTPMPEELQSYLAFHRSGGGDSLAMEVSSHALVQGRADPVRFDVAGFLNLTQDHLDYHKTMEEYFEAKASLFTERRSRVAVVCVDDEWGRTLVERSEVPTHALAVWSTLPELPEGIVGWQVAAEDGRFTLTSTDGRRIEASTALPGDFNVANAAVAIVMVLAAGHSARRVAAALSEPLSPAVPGRMEVLSSAPRVIVDFAHNTEALVKAMTNLRSSTRGRLVVLTGAAGERDRGKRPAMGRAVATYADAAVITDDDPHDEDPSQIRREVLEGLRDATIPVVEIPDRARAIAACIEEASDEDTILIAGRGHETIQEVAGVPIELDDRVEARAALARRGLAKE